MTRSQEEAPAIGTGERRSRELDGREQALLDAAVALMDRDDWEAVTVEEIARRAEHAKGTVYRHFASKDDLYARLVTDWSAGTCAALEALDADRPFEPLVRDLVAVAWRRLDPDSAATRVHARLFHHVERADFLAGVTPATRAALAAADARLLALLAAVIGWGIAEGAIPRAP
ncbi:MAG TPA: helix-turn-helix domain-containing protein, partial [Amaricoccus sp.]|nr:helix-turn-helix domain-containing protein [Amaricoccus sp.]